MILTRQWQLINDLGERLLQQAASATRVADIERLTTLGLKCLDKAQRIADEMGLNSIMVYLAVAKALDKGISFEEYASFCQCEGFAVANKQLFDQFCSYLIDTGNDVTMIEK